MTRQKDISIKQSGRTARKWKRYEKREKNDPYMVGRRRSLRLWIKRLKQLCLCVALLVVGMGIVQLFIWYLSLIIICFGG